MKFNILVVAAMVITSVNAGWHRRPKVVPGGDDSKPGSVSSQDLSEGDSSMSQDTDHTNKESSNDSDTNVVSENIFCDFLTLAAKDLQASLVERADEFRGHLASLHMLQETAETLKEEQMENHSASTERVNGILEAIKKEFAKLLKEYYEVWGNVEKQRMFGRRLLLDRSRRYGKSGSPPRFTADNTQECKCPRR
ncbi:hypothetical protein BASA60_003011 [Batrachochytrium salamandrivorans]|nr:hypothetical protein BASA60_003011 [Batrachochytrium salamandrivorans]